MIDLIGQMIGRYHIIEELGEGGMALVYKAYDTRLNCNVALKMIRTEKITPESAPVVLKRFENEARKTAKLTHPNIVSVTDYGSFEGIPYLVMKFIPGGTLKQLTGKPLSYQKAIQLTLPIANALQYAHSHGIIHRDVKPANILLTESGEPLLSDFGVAKILEFQEETLDHLTVSGIGIGTPEYMSPEQAEGKRVDPRADIYALGVVLYELITGRKPFIADTPLAVIIKQTTDPLPKPSSFVQDLPKEVEQVLFKALAKKPEDRYTSMAEFEDNLKQLLKDSPSNFHAQTAQSRKTKKAILISLISLLAIGVLISFTFFNKGFSNPRNQVNRQSSISTPNVAPFASSTTAATTASLTITPIAESTPDISMMLSNPYLGPAPEGALLRIGRGTINDAVFSPDGNELIVVSGLGIYFYDSSAMNLDSFIESKKEITTIALNSQKNLFATADVDGNIDVWDYLHRTVIKTFTVQKGNNVGLLFSQDGNLLISGSDDKTVYIWSTEDWQLIRKFSIGPNCISSIAVSTDSKYLVTSYYDNSLEIWGIRSGEKIKSLAVPATITGMDLDVCGFRGEGSGGVNSIGFSRDNKYLYLSSGGYINFWNTEGWAQMNGKRMYINLAYSPDAAKVVYESYSSLELNDYLSGDQLASTSLERVHSSTNDIGDVFSGKKLFFSPDSTKLARITSSFIALWRIDDFSAPKMILGHSSVGLPVFDPTDDAVIYSNSAVYYDIAGTLYPPVIKWDLQDLFPQLFFEPEPTNSKLTSFMILPKENLLAGVDEQYKIDPDQDDIYLWNFQTGTYIRQLPETNDFISTLATSNNGDYLASGSNDGTIVIWDVASRSIFKTLTGISTTITDLVFSPDGNILASISQDNTLKFWNLSNLKQSHSFGLSSPAKKIIYTRDGKFLISGDKEGVLSFWDTSIMAITKTLDLHHGEIISLDISQDGTMVAASEQDGTLSIWDLDTMDVIKEFNPQKGEIFSDLKFSPAGNYLASDSGWGTIVIWPVRSENILFNDSMPTEGVSDATLTNEISTKGELPDLVALNSTLSTEYGGNIAIGDAEFNLCFVIYNKGVGVSPASQIVVSTTGFSGKPISIPVLVSGQSKTVCGLLSKSFSVQLTPCGDYTCVWGEPDFCQDLKFVVDPDNLIVESDETNNVYSTQICHHPKQ